MERVVRIDDDDLATWAALATEDRLRQAIAAFQLFHALHRPYAIPFTRGFDTLEEYFEFDKENSLRLRPGPS